MYVEQLNNIDHHLRSFTFFTSVPANSSICLCSNKISSPFQVIELQSFFPLGTNCLVSHKFYISPDDNTGSQEPNGLNFLSGSGSSNCIVGDNCLIKIQHYVYSNEKNTYLKCWFTNDDAFDHLAFAVITIKIQLLGEEVPE